MPAGPASPSVDKWRTDGGLQWVHSRFAAIIGVRTLGSVLLGLGRGDARTARVRSAGGNAMSDTTKPASERPFLDRHFGLTEHGTDVRTAFIAGITTFLTMLYIVFVHPQILANASIDKGAVF